MLKLVAGAVLLLLFALLAGANAHVLWRGLIRKEERVPSMVPIVGGLFGAVGVSLLIGKSWAWLPALLDPGCAFYLALAVRGSLRREP